LILVFDKAVQFIAKGSNSGLPNEGLKTLEQPEADKIGIAIYAAPRFLIWLDYRYS